MPPSVPSRTEAPLHEQPKAVLLTITWLWQHNQCLAERCEAGRHIGEPLDVLDLAGRLDA